MVLGETPPPTRSHKWRPLQVAIPYFFCNFMYPPYSLLRLSSLWSVRVYPQPRRVFTLASHLRQQCAMLVPMQRWLISFPQMVAIAKKFQFVPFLGLSALCSLFAEYVEFHPSFAYLSVQCMAVPMKGLWFTSLALDDARSTPTPSTAAPFKASFWLFPKHICLLSPFTPYCIPQPSWLGKAGIPFLQTPQ